jgi:beta-glucanase (GH16 family)
VKTGDVRLRGRLGPAVLALVALGILPACRHDPTAPEQAWQVVWEDEFDGPAGQIPNATRWRFDVGTDWGNAQLEYDTNRATNASTDGNGNLTIVARKEAYQGRSYTSARINTRGYFERAYGRFEARIKLPVGQGIWPAFWLLGADQATVPWPACGEIDIMEFRGQLPNIVTGSLHGPGYSGGSAWTGSFERTGAGFDQDFHVFAIEWSPDRITWLVDGQAYQRVTREEFAPSRDWVFDHPFFIILNVAVGGNYVGPPDATTVFPQTMTVDYVRVYGLAP